MAKVQHKLNRLQLAKLQQLALKEAANRQKLNGIDPWHNSDNHVNTSSDTIEAIEVAEEYEAQLEKTLEEETTRNDVDWETVRIKLNGLKALDDWDTGKERRDQKDELAALKFEIANVQQELPQLGPPMNEMAMTINSRSILESSIVQHENGLLCKRQDLQEEKQCLEQDEITWHHLQEVQRGLEMKRARLIEKEKQRSDPSDTIRTLQKKVEAVEVNLNHLLTSLISLSDSLFDSQEGDKRRQLRHLIDRLVNAAWDSPDNPWINVEDQYNPSIVTFLIRANIAVYHPNDGRSVRLVQFYK